MPAANTAARNCLGNMGNSLTTLENRAATTNRLLEELLARDNDIVRLMEERFSGLYGTLSEQLAVTNRVQEQINQLTDMVNELSLRLTGHPAIQNDQP